MDIEIGIAGQCVTFGRADLDGCVLVGADFYSVMNFDPLDFEIEWPFSNCQSREGMSLDISTKSGITGKIGTYKIGYEN
ncbi:hypothetical protein J3P71_15495 [Rhizobium leguminosarum]|uniref:hypothetical protein n=1 Tax=Rhizobium leguminosarum TaxID=384 RepID=UPI001441A463|nr:hypothetical protein [Rhizobium leguminosarum]MBY5841467.1 hypothetical protein [Rhizobium leguminosarum]NKM82106.1 hypothetical protein [Rhizobium leguminosarum bv. viciae]QSZ06294.1 hypothetical protein J3P71_15495 [Rhizobium leguminosarum]